MTINRRKKNSRQRGSTTHGWGSMKKHRGAGNRGGKGLAGSGKRADTLKPSLWKEKYNGKRGFKRKNAKVIKPINLSFIELNIESLLLKKIAAKEGDYYLMDIGKMGFNKILGGGRITKKFKIIAECASKNAIEKVKKMGGEVKVKG